MPKTVSCPHCKKEVIWNKESKFRPFCCERCRLQDLGAWFLEERSINDNPQNTLADDITVLPPESDSNH